VISDKVQLHEAPELLEEMITSSVPSDPFYVMNMLRKELDAA